jgi:hypothetical protein
MVREFNENVIFFVCDAYGSYYFRTTHAPRTSPIPPSPASTFIRGFTSQNLPNRLRIKDILQSQPSSGGPRSTSGLIALYGNPRRYFFQNKKKMQKKSNFAIIYINRLLQPEPRQLKTRVLLAGTLNLPGLFWNNKLLTIYTYQLWFSFKIEIARM